MFRNVCDPSSGSVERAWLKLLVISTFSTPWWWIANDPKRVRV